MQAYLGITVMAPEGDDSDNSAFSLVYDAILTIDSA